MSSTTPAGYRDQHFWIYDVCASILFAEMAAVAEETPAEERSAWLAGLERELRIHARVGADFNVPFDEWCDGHEEEFPALVAAASRRLAECGAITAQQAAAWIVLDDHPIIWRRESAVDCGAIVAFADALTAIIRGTYAQAPPGHWWFFGVAAGPQTIRIPHES